MSGITDKPVAEIKGDRFNIERYIRGLCDFILKCETPMTISIQGDWGSGKTSMMNMIEGEIKNQVYPIMFNTWQFSQFNQSSALAPAMIGFLIDALAPEQGKGAEIITKAKKLQGALRVVAILGAGVIGGSDGAGTVKETLDGKQEESVDPATALLELKDTFQEAIKAKLAETGKSRVVVFVDDLDRLQPEKAVELLEVLKLFLDCEDCVFVLAVDYEVVTRGIKKKFGEDVDGAKGKSFFDKIIQLPFKMPVSNYDVKQYIQENLKAMALDCKDEDAEVYVRLLKASIGLNPRAMKRLFNTFQLLDIISSSAVEGVDPATRQRMLFGIICMQMAYEGLYRDIAVRCRGKLTSEDLMDLAKGDYVREPESDLYQSLAELRENDEDESHAVARMHAFMSTLVDAIDADNNGVIDESELNQFTDIMRCSGVTSVGGDEEGGHTDENWTARKKIQEQARQVEEVVKSAMGASPKLAKLKYHKTKFPRKKEDFRKAIVETEVILPDGHMSGLSAYIEYVDKDNTQLLISLETWDKASQSEKYRKQFGSDALRLGALPEITKYGSQDYDMGIISNDDLNNVIVESFEKAMASLEEQGVIA